MLLLVWSLFQNAVRFGRRQKLFSSLDSFLQDRRKTRRNSICCRPVGRLIFAHGRPGSRWTPFHTANSLLRRAPSEPALATNSAYLAHDSRIYCDGQREIMLVEAKYLPEFRLTDWSFHITFSRWNFDQRLVYFVVSTCPSAVFGPCPSLPSSNSSFLNSLATQIAHLRANPALCLYSSLPDDFAELVFRWSEGLLFEASSHQRIEEIRTIPSPFGKIRFYRPRPRSKCLSVPSRVLESDESLSMASNSTLVEHGRGEETPYSLLELLFRKEMGISCAEPFRRWKSDWHCDRLEMGENRELGLSSACSPSAAGLSRLSTISLSSAGTQLPNYFIKLRSKANRRRKANGELLPEDKDDTTTSDCSQSAPSKSGELASIVNMDDNATIFLESGKSDGTISPDITTSTDQFPSEMISVSEGNNWLAHCVDDPGGWRRQEAADSLASSPLCSLSAAIGVSRSFHLQTEATADGDGSIAEGMKAIVPPSPHLLLEAIPHSQIAIHRQLPFTDELLNIIASSSERKDAANGRQRHRFNSLVPALEGSTKPSAVVNGHPGTGSRAKMMTAAALGSQGHHLSKSTSLLAPAGLLSSAECSPLSPGCQSSCSAPFANSALRRRSLSPLTISLLVNYGGGQDLIGNTALLNADPHFPGKLPLRRHHSVTRRSLCSRRTNSESSGGGGDGQQGIDGKGSSSTTCGRGDEPRHKPPALLVYCGDEPSLFAKIKASLRKVVPADTFTISPLSTRALLDHPWMDSCACLLITSTKPLDDRAWSRLQTYFVNSGKILFVCENSLLSSLTNCTSSKKQSSLLKNVFGNKSVTANMGKEFGAFLKRALKGLADSKKKEVNETFYARDLVGGSRFSVILLKKEDQPLLLYMQNLEQKASALFSDATTEELLCSGNSSLIRDALCRVGVKNIRPGGEDAVGMELPVNCRESKGPALSPGYLIARKDTDLFGITGLTYREELGARPTLLFKPTSHLVDAVKDQQGNVEADGEHDGKFSWTASGNYLPVEVRRRKDGLPASDGAPDFDVATFYGVLATKRLGRVLLYVPVCTSTMDISDSLSTAFPLFDGILVVASRQVNGRGRSGNDWISPPGCAMFTFNFNIPFNSQLGNSLGYLQHIVAVSIADAVAELLADEVPDFPVKLKWPNDIYYERSHKLGGVLVQASQRDSSYWCLIGAALNVTNSKPTVCINDMLPIDSKRQLRVEEVLAAIMNKFEHYVNLFEHKGRAEFLKVYYKFWMHSHEEVSIESGKDKGRESVVIRGLDAFGHLEVRSKRTGQLMSVTNDGNSFDMLHGLITSQAH